MTDRQPRPTARDSAGAAPAASGAPARPAADAAPRGEADAPAAGHRAGAATAPRAGRWPPKWLAPHRGTTLRALSWLARAVAFTLIGVETFAGPGLGSASMKVTAGAYALCGLTLVPWGLLEVRANGLRRGTQVFLLAITATASAAVCTLPHAGALLGLAIIAVIDAGGATDLTAGWTVTGLGVLAVETGGLLNGSDRAVLLGYPLSLLAGLLIGYNRRVYRVRAEETAALLAQVEQLRAEQRRAAVLEERARIAREIHDVLAHSLGALGIQIQTARTLIDHDTRRADDLLGVAQRMAADGLADTRRAVQALRTDVPPLPQALAGIAETHRQHHHAAVTVSVEGGPATLPPERTVCLVRVAQESLTNAAKHAPAQAVDIALRYEDHQVTLTVSNPLGDRAPTTPRLATVDGGYGLTGMRERLLLLGGTLTAGAHDRRWTVTARVSR
ncbi:sensor histidine kinase [Streptantibioticus silvisoli]|uniref:histidine kinase n=1 Tax=Streptantibioticus silvisoli TaxID=2705255 RepID=A0ABT6W5K1_9ACTN|nr:histidine kinase [Streptantibioticus silvisoli]MDI5966029.1 histidine kinase [Streptantibioticus silvisoli]